MQAWRPSGLSCLFLLLASTALAQTPAPAENPTKAAANKEKIVGTWEASSGDLPKGAVVEFTKDGKVKTMAKVEGETVSVVDTYEVEGDQLRVTHKDPDGKEVKETLKIKSLTDKKLVTVDPRGTTDEFTRK